MLWLMSNRTSIWFEIFNSQSSPRQIYNKTTITPNAHLIRRSEFREVLSEFRICSYANFHPQLCFKISHFPWLFMLLNINHRNMNLFLPPNPTCRTQWTSKTTAKIDPRKTKGRSEKLPASPGNMAHVHPWQRARISLLAMRLGLYTLITLILTHTCRIKNKKFTDCL